MKRRIYILIAAACLGLAVITVTFFGVRYMNDPTRMTSCYFLKEAEFSEAVASHNRVPLSAPTEPTRQFEFTLSFPFKVFPDDILLISAYTESRDDEHRFYDGPPPPDGNLFTRLPVKTETSGEGYWFFVNLIREKERMICVWAAEENFQIPAPPHPVRWQLDLLAEPIDTGDGGQRLTRFTAIE